MPIKILWKSQALYKRAFKVFLKKQMEQGNDSLSLAAFNLDFT